MTVNEDINIKLKLEGQQRIDSAFRKLNGAGKNLQTSFNKLGTSIAGVAKNLALVTGAAVAAGGALFALTKRNAELNDEISKLSQQTGISGEKLQELRFASEQVGLEASAFSQGVRNLSVRLGELQQKGTGTLDTFFKESDAGFLQTLKGAKDVDTAFELIIARLRAATSEQERNSIAGAVFGNRVGPKVAQLARLSAQEFEELRVQLRESGNVLSSELLQQSEDFNDTLNRLSQSVQGVSRRLTSALEPAFIAGAEALTKFLDANREAFLNRLKPAIDDVVTVAIDFFRILSGDELENVNEKAVELAEGFRNLRDSTAQVFSAIGTAINIISTALTPLAKLVGLDSGLQLGIVALALKFTGIIGVVQALIGVIVSLGGVFKALGAVLALSPLGVVPTVIIAITGAISALIISIIDFGAVWEDLKGIVLGVGRFIIGIIEDIGQALAGLVRVFADSFTAILSTISGFFAAAGGLVLEGITNIGDLFTTIGDNLLNFFSSILGAIRQLVTEAFRFVGDQFRSILDGFRNLLSNIRNAISSAFRGVRDAASDAVGSVREIVTGSTGARRFATGGHVRGPGTAKSDSIPALLSNGEYVIKAASVRKFGKGLFDNLNSGVFPVVQKFADGGLVGAVDGLISSTFPITPSLDLDRSVASPSATGRPLNLILPSGQTIRATTSDNSAKELERNLRRADSAKPGSLPAWYR